VCTTGAFLRASLPVAVSGGIVRRMKTRVAIVSLLAAATLGACGDSAEDKAQAQVCDARADISEQVDSLKSLTLTTATTSQIRDSLTAIRDDLSKIKDAQSDLNDDRKSQVQRANQAFGSQVRSVLATLGTTTSLSEAGSQLSEALDQLASTYEDTFAKVDCG
jgi:hypothetical protein